MGVAVFCLMTYGTHDVGLMTLVVNGIAHRLAVDGKTFILFAMGFIPAPQGAVKLRRIDADEQVADDIFAWNYETSIFTTTTETLSS